MLDIYENLKNGDIYYALQACRTKRIHYVPMNVINMLVASHKIIFTELLEFFVNYISEEIVLMTITTVMRQEECNEKIIMIMDFLKKYNLEWMLYRNIDYMLENAIRHNRINTITELIVIVKYFKIWNKFTNVFLKINNLNIFKHIINNCNIKNYIDENINIFFYNVLAGGNKDIIMYIIKNYVIIFDYDIIKNINGLSGDYKYYTNIGIRMDLINNTNNNIILI